MAVTISSVKMDAESCLCEAPSGSQAVLQTPRREFRICMNTFKTLNFDKLRVLSFFMYKV
jgi:hypothetical protein